MFLYVMKIKKREKEVLRFIYHAAVSNSLCAGQQRGDGQVDSKPAGLAVPTDGHSMQYVSASEVRRKTKEQRLLKQESGTFLVMAFCVWPFKNRVVVVVLL